MTRDAATTDAVVLRAVDIRESDRILTFLSRDLGVVSALARGARSSRKRFGGALGLFTLSRLELSRKAGAEIYTLHSADSQRAFLELAADMTALAHASYATELVRELTRPEQPDPGLFDLLVELYRTMSELGPSVMMLRRFEICLLEEIGLGLVLDGCVSCGAADDADLADGAVLDAARGGVLCSACAALSRSLGVRILPGAARELLVAARDADSLAAAHQRGLDGIDPPEAQIAARDALMAAVRAHVGKPLRSLEFVSKLRS